jgi:uncharacterized protein with ParB-like and HNH nuclease domain
MKITQFCDIPRFTRDGNYQVDYPLDHLIGFIDNEVNTQGLQLNPDFQRGNVWSEEQQIRFMEFILRGGKTARIIYFNCPSWNRSVADGEYDDYVCVDGLQRITAIRRFMNNEIKVFGSYLNEFTDKMRIMQDTMKVNINDLKSKKEVLQWYLDFNTGGTVHSNDEIERVRKLLEAENQIK